MSQKVGLGRIERSASEPNYQSQNQFPKEQGRVIQNVTRPCLYFIVPLLHSSC